VKENTWEKWRSELIGLADRLGILKDTDIRPHSHHESYSSSASASASASSFTPHSSLNTRSLHTKLPHPPSTITMAGGGIPLSAPALATGFLKGRALIYPLALVISLFFLWGFSYGLLDVLNKHFQTVLGVTKLQSTGLQVVYFGGGYLLFSPIAAEVMKRKGYKITILMGLSLYSLGAIMFWLVLFPFLVYFRANPFLGQQHTSPPMLIVMLLSEVSALAPL
jgi:fucose permease